MPTGPADGGSVSYYEGLIAAKWGTAAGNAYVAFAASHPSYSPQQAASAYIETVLVKSLGSLGAGIGGTVSVEAGVPGAAAKGAENAIANLSPGEWLNKLGSLVTSRALWIRVAEGVLGLVLVLVAAAELGKGTAVGNAIKKVPFI